MANDFSLFIVDWPRLVQHFESSSIAGETDTVWGKRDFHERAQLVGDFLGCLHESEFSTSFSEITRFHGASDSFHLWSCFAETYSEVRAFLEDEDRGVYDEMYLPFVAPWVQGLKQSAWPFELPDTLRKRLFAGGLGLAISPERTKGLAELNSKYSFSRFVHEALASKNLPPPLPGRASFFHDMIDGVDTQLGHLHRSYTEMTEGWRILSQQASFRKWGIVATYII